MGRNETITRKKKKKRNFVTPFFQRIKKKNFFLRNFCWGWDLGNFEVIFEASAWNVIKLNRDFSVLGQGKLSRCRNFVFDFWILQIVFCYVFLVCFIQRWKREKVMILEDLMFCVMCFIVMWSTKIVYSYYANF